jgi:hypothetical protein
VRYVQEVAVDKFGRLDKFEAGGEGCFRTPHLWGNPPVVLAQVLCPGMDATPTGALSFVQAKPVNNERHNDASGNRQQELLHKASPPRH